MYSDDTASLKEQTSTKLDLNLSEPSSCGHDLSTVLQDIFHDIYQSSKSSDDKLEKLIKALPLGDEYGEKYTKELETIYQTREKQKSEINVVQNYFTKVRLKHELDKRKGKDIEYEESEQSLDKIFDIIDDEMGEEDLNESKLSSGNFKPEENDLDDEIDDGVESLPSAEIGLTDDEELLIKPGFSDSIFEFAPSEITLTPTTEEYQLLHKFAPLFSEPLFIDILKHTENYPSNRGLKHYSSKTTEHLQKKSCGKLVTKLTKRQISERTSRMSLKGDLKTKDDLKEETLTFRAIPKEVVFTDCKPGKIYKTNLELQNVTEIPQYCSVIPPRSGVFLIEEGKYPTANRGNVASGLSCKFIIRFRPIMYKDYEDEVVVFTQKRQSFTVKIVAKTTKPYLKYENPWFLHDCFVHTQTNSIFTIKNTLLAGKFWFYNGYLNEELVEEMFKKPKNIHDNTVQKLKNFDITPCYFELGIDQSTTFSVNFTPSFEGTIQENVSILCESMKTIHYLTITGKSLFFRKNSISLIGRWNFPRPQEIWDAYANHFLNFDVVYAFNLATKSFKLKNRTAIPLKFKWKFIKPRYYPAKLTFISQQEPSLFISPDSGELSEREELEVKLRFKPFKEMKLHTVLQLVVEDIPEECVHPSLDEDLLIKENPGIVDIHVLSVDVQGICNIHELHMFPPGLNIPGTLEAGVTSRHLVHMKNDSNAITWFKWSRCLFPHIIEVEPFSGYVGAKNEMDMEVLITPCQIGKFNESLLCQTQDRETTLHLQLSFEVVGPKVIIENGLMNLGLIRVERTVEKILTLRNTVSIYVPWQLRDVTERALCNQKDINTLRIDPDSGTLGPLKRQHVNVSWKPMESGSIRNIIELKADEVVQCHLSVVGEALQPQVCLRECTFFAGNVYRSVPFNTLITLINQTCLETSFTWEEAEGVDAKSCTILIEPSTGELLGSECKTVTVTCTVNDLISFHDVCVPCWIDGMDEPLYWSLSGEVNGIEVFCAIDIDNRRYCATLKEKGFEEEPHFDLDFGIEIPLNNTVIKEIHLTNNSAIKARFFANTKNFNACSFLSDNSEEIPELSNRKIKELLKQQLQTGSGLALVINPLTGWILPFNCITIQVIGKADMWGLYKDLLTIQITKLKLIHMNVIYNAVGLPIRFFAAPRDKTTFTLRFGACLKGSKNISRRVNVENTGPCDLNIAFQTFNIDDKTDNRKLLGLECYANDRITYENALSCEKCKIETLQNLTYIPARKKLVCLCLSPFIGKVESEIFSLSPECITLKARSIAELTATFNPSKVNLNTDILTLCCYCTGIVCIHSKLLLIPNTVYRQQKRAIEPIEIEMSGRLINPKLIHCAIDENEFLFTLNGGEFLFGKPDTLEVEKSIRFVNYSSVAMETRFTITEPFSITGCKINSRVINNVITPDCRQIKKLVLQTSDELKLSLKFTLDRNYVDSICTNSPCSSISRIFCVNEISENLHQLHFERNLVVNIEESNEEIYKVVGIIDLPYLSLATSHINFGTCFIGQTHCQEVGILNFSQCDTSFCVVFEYSSDEFRVEPTEGCVFKKYSDLAPGRTDLDIYFYPSCTARCQQSIIIYGPFGMEPLQVFIEGTGTLDESYKRDYDVTETT